MNFILCIINVVFIFGAIFRVEVRNFNFLCLRKSKKQTLLQRTGAALQRTGGVVARTGSALERTWVALQRTGGAMKRTGGALYRTGVEC